MLIVHNYRKIIGAISNYRIHQYLRDGCCKKFNFHPNYLSIFYLNITYKINYELKILL